MYKMIWEMKYIYLHNLYDFLLFGKFGGGNNGSNTILNTLSKSYGIKRASVGDEESKSGFVFASMSFTLNWSSIIKSSPNNSKLKESFYASILWKMALIQSVATFLSSGYTSS